MASFLAIGIPILAIILLCLALRRDPKGPSSSVRTLPRSELSRQVWKATKPSRAAKRIAVSQDEAKPRPKFAPLTPPAKVSQFRPPPRQRDRRGA